MYNNLYPTFLSKLFNVKVSGKKLQSEEFSQYQEVYDFVKKKKKRKKETAVASFVQPAVKFGLVSFKLDS